MNERDFWDAESARNFLKRTEGTFLRKAVCTGVVAALLGLIILLEEITGKSALLLEDFYFWGGLGALVISGAVFTLLKFVSKVYLWTLLLLPLPFWGFMIAIILSGAILLSGLVITVIPMAADTLLLFIRRKRAEQYTKF